MRRSSARGLSSVAAELDAGNTDLLAGRLVMSFMTQRGAMPPDGFLPGSVKHLTKPENKAKHAEALQLYKDTADLVHDLLDETEMERRVEGVFDKLLPGARNTRGKLTKGAIEIVIAVDDAEPQWPHVDVLTPGKLQVLVYLNGVQVHLYSVQVHLYSVQVYLYSVESGVVQADEGLPDGLMVLAALLLGAIQVW